MMLVCILFDITETMVLLVGATRVIKTNIHNKTSCKNSYRDFCPTMSKNFVQFFSYHIMSPLPESLLQFFKYQLILGNEQILIRSLSDNIKFLSYTHNGLLVFFLPYQKYFPFTERSMERVHNNW